MQGRHPIVLYHLDHQVRKLNWQVYSRTARPCTRVQLRRALRVPLTDSTATSFFEFDWDGMRSQDNGRGNGDHRKVVPNGTYVLR